MEKNNSIVDISLPHIIDGSGVDFRARKRVLVLARQISKHFLGRGGDKIYHGAQIKDTCSVLLNIYLHKLE
ncbi:hypothetical protein F2P79_012200 [Pimephales promelas]|nr:hypothetical protein F2P79_012200 [Pimephales promelas]